MVEQLKSQAWLQDPRLASLFGAIEGAGGQIRVAGGAVRNGLWGLAINDIDAATTLTPDVVLTVCKAAGFSVHPTGLQHGTVTVVVDGLVVEVTTLRTDIKTDGRHAVVGFTLDWHEDAMRRDFTVNALYCDLTGKVFDETGHGLDDIETKRIAFVGDAGERIKEDYLRILRFFRFEARFGQGVLDPTGLAACIEHKQGLKALSAERIWAELSKTLVAVRASPIIAAMFEVGILQELIEVTRPLSCLARLCEIEASHDIEPDAIRRLGCLTNEAGHLRLSGDEKKRFKALSTMPTLNPTLSEQAQKVLLYENGQQTYRDCCLIQWALGVEDVENKDWFLLYQLPERWPIPVFPIKGKDLLGIGISSGKHMGEMLSELEVDWKQSRFSATKKQLLDAALANKFN